jgi:hypothetical protein
MKKIITLFFLAGIALFVQAQSPVNHSILNLFKEQLFKKFSVYGEDVLGGYDILSAYKTALEKEHITTVQELKSFFYIDQTKFLNKNNSVTKSSGTSFIPSNKSVQTAGCDNLDFENGDYTNWAGKIGYNTNSDSNFTVTDTGIFTLGMNQPSNACTFHTLISSAYGNDPFGIFFGVGGNNGSYVLRLGGNWINLANFQCTNGPSPTYSSAESIEQTITIDSSNANITLQYAVILNDGGHAPGAQPYFSVRFYDQNGDTLPSSYFQYYQAAIAGVPPPGYSTSIMDSGVYYLPWTEYALNFSAYIGQQITIRFTASGCMYGAHFAYAYVDAACSPAVINVSGDLPCTGSGTVSLAAPAHAGGSYTWTGPGIVGSNTSQSITADAVGVYSVDIAPTNGNPYTLSAPVSSGNVFVQATASAPSCVGCTDGSIALQPQGGNPPYNYSLVPSIGNFTGSSYINLPAGTYYLCVSDVGSCQYCDSVVVPPHTVGIASVSETENSFIFPNPTEGEFRIQNSKFKMERIDVFNIFGEKVYSKNINSQSSTINCQLSKGVYFVRLNAGEKVLTEKIVIE